MVKVKVYFTMALRAVQNDNNAQMSYIKSSATGALVGYSLKYILPITPQEKDEIYNSFLSEREARVKKAKSAEIEEIRKSVKHSDTADNFISLYDAKKLTFSKTQKLKKSLNEGLYELVKRVNDAGRAEKIKLRKDLTAITKSIRPTGTFVILGILAGLIIAFIKNITNNTATNNS